MRVQTFAALLTIAFIFAASIHLSIAVQRRAAYVAAGQSCISIPASEDGAGRGCEG